jgi:glycosyltransferase involved in cell wall biosynthesis
MKILLAAKHAPHGPRPIGGVQSWCRTVEAELVRRGHDVQTWGPGQPPPLGGHDLGIIANPTDTARAYDWCKKTLTVCHGIIPAESPTGDNVVYTSEEVRAHWGGDGPIIRQPIDLEFWTPVRSRRRFLTRFSYRGGLPFLPVLAKSLGMIPKHVRNSSAEEARDVLRESACVIATGRAALEAMACGVPVVICDHRSAYQQPLFDPDTTGAMTRNYSGRGGVRPTLDNIKTAVKTAMKNGSMRNHIEENHDVKNVVNELLEVA